MTELEELLLELVEVVTTELEELVLELVEVVVTELVLDELDVLGSPIEPSAKSFCQFNTHAKGEFQLMVISLVANAPISSFQQVAGFDSQLPGAPSAVPTKLLALGPPDIAPGGGVG